MRITLSIILTLALPGPLGAFWGDPYRKLAKVLTKDMGEWGGKKAAVVPFRYADGRSSAGGAAVASALETALVGRKALRLVERGQIAVILQELKLQRTGLVPADSALKVGAMSGADLLVTGTLVDRGSGKTEVHAKLILVETGEVLRAARARVRKIWADAAPVRFAGPGKPPAAGVLAVTLAAPKVSGSARRIDGRALAFRYADQGGRPVIRVTDYSGEKRPVWVEVPIEYEPRTNTYREFSRDFRLAGRKYRMWSDLRSNLHVAPRQGLLGMRTADDQEIVLGMEPVFRAWIEDIDSRNQELRLYFGPPNAKVLAYFEPLNKGNIRISIFKALGRNPPPGCVFDCRFRDYDLDYQPLDVEVLKGRRGKRVKSRLMSDGFAYYRFHYSADTQEIKVEKVK